MNSLLGGTEFFRKNEKNWLKDGGTISKWKSNQKDHELKFSVYIKKKNPKAQRNNRKKWISTNLSTCLKI